MRDIIGETGGASQFLFIENNPIDHFDYKGLIILDEDIKKIIKSHRCNELRKKFDEWFNQNKDMSWTKELLPCPAELKLRKTILIIQTVPNATQLERISCENPDPEKWDLTKGVQFWLITQKFHPGGSYELRSKPSPNGHGSQCIYDECCKLIRSIPTAGSADRTSPNVSILDHRRDDVNPYNWAIELDECFPGLKPSFVERYFQRRPSM